MTDLEPFRLNYFTMTLEQLKIFLAVAEQMHFTRAAEQLYITQPAVSAAIQTLEALYGVKLFHRVGRRVELTEAGRFLQLEAQKILDQVVLTERGLRELNNLQRGELKLGASLTIGNYWLPAKISQFKRQYPGIFVNCTLGNAEEICEGTANGLLDLGLVTGEIKPSLSDQLEQTIVGTDRLQIVVGQSHPWYKQPPIPVAELLQTDWVMRESGSGAQQMFERSLQSWGIDPTSLNVILVLNSSEMVKAVVEGGVGAAALPVSMVRQNLALATLYAIRLLAPPAQQGHTDIVQPILKLKHRQRYQSRSVQAFEQMLLAESDCQDLG
ncbi:MAG: LysR substrate-binding domain-containing protein [Leptolyngbya sp. BL-A-14]